MYCRSVWCEVFAADVWITRACEIRLFKTFSVVMVYLHFTHALQLRQIRVDFVNQVHFQILDSALER